MNGSTAWVFLVIAIVAEVIGTSFLKASAGFTKPLPSLMVAVGFTATLMASVYIVFTFFGPLIEASTGASSERRLVKK